MASHEASSDEDEDDSFGGLDLCLQCYSLSTLSNVNEDLPSQHEEHHRFVINARLPLETLLRLSSALDTVISSMENKEVSSSLPDPTAFAPWHVPADVAIVSPDPSVEELPEIVRSRLTCGKCNKTFHNRGFLTGHMTRCSRTTRVHKPPTPEARALMSSEGLTGTRLKEWTASYELLRSATRRHLREEELSTMRCDHLYELCLHLGGKDYHAAKPGRTKVVQDIRNLYGTARSP
eukprot:CAMPEP_0184357106 /NCGR_PEP_ID=MMETSP1089-20130417/106971_1 /TAXON_ID=38269 ORGANISM="Gloeochaete wittrockiana, Strain SAG46.84" /NCGR_SAMPLE_ID=MMETSP1089 /ASSEMBLY_ACC=CAM_ASM_000445 /LENGTH=234 /DNA_ID=CAMNT_0026694687 /DNA_START=21 /DNA_END=722 /DNA_ORIENTATION=+